MNQKEQMFVFHDFTKPRVTAYLYIRIDLKKSYVITERKDFQVILGKKTEMGAYWWMIPTLSYFTKEELSEKCRLCKEGMINQLSITAALFEIGLVCCICQFIIIAFDIQRNYVARVLGTETH